jgi:hypothetical protein
MLCVTDIFGALRKHVLNTVPYPAPAAHARVIERGLIVEIEQLALVNRAGKDLEQSLFQCH